MEGSAIPEAARKSAIRNSPRMSSSAVGCKTRVLTRLATLPPRLGADTSSFVSSLCRVNLRHAMNTIRETMNTPKSGTTIRITFPTSFGSTLQKHTFVLLGTAITVLSQINHSLIKIS